MPALWAYSSMLCTYSCSSCDVWTTLLRVSHAQFSSSKADSADTNYQMYDTVIFPLPCIQHFPGTHFVSVPSCIPQSEPSTSLAYPCPVALPEFPTLSLRFYSLRPGHIYSLPRYSKQITHNSRSLALAPYMDLPTPSPVNQMPHTLSFCCL